MTELAIIVEMLKNRKFSSHITQRNERKIEIYKRRNIYYKAFLVSSSISTNIGSTDAV